MVLANLEDPVRQQWCRGCPKGELPAPPAPSSLWCCSGLGPSAMCLVCPHLPVLPLGAGGVPEGCPGPSELGSQLPWALPSTPLGGPLASKALGLGCPQGRGGERRDANILATTALRCVAGDVAQTPLSDMSGSLRFWEGWKEVKEPPDG